MQGIPYALPLFLAAGALAFLAHYGWRHRTAHPAAPAFVRLVVPVAVWLVAYGFEILAADVAAKEAWETVIIVDLAWLPLFWLLFAIHYSGQEAWLTRLNLVFLALPSAATTLLTLTNPLHGLVWTDITIDSSGPFLATVPIRGPWFWVHSLACYSYILAGNALFVVFILRAAAIFRRQALAIVLSSMIPLVGNALHLAGMIPVPGFDPGAFVFALSAGFTAVALFRYRLLNVVPIAQRAVLDHLLEGVIVLDSHDRIVDINPAARRMLDLGTHDPVGQLAADVLRPPEILTHCTAPGEEPMRILVTRGEAQRWHEVLALPMTDTRGRHEGRILVVRDVTEAGAVEMLREDLARVTVHDLRNPLTVVAAGLDALSSAGPEELDPGLTNFVQLARASCRHALDLVNTILQVSQLESGRMPLNRQPIEAARLIADVMQGIDLLARENELDLEVHVPADLPVVYADEGLLRRVLENLAGNAIKFTPPGGRVTVAARPLDDALLIQVSDTGPGIPPEVAGRLFQKFSSGPGPQQGTGLGLAFCRLAVEAHGGRIWIDSTSPRGTSVHCTIPLRDSQPGDSPPQPFETASQPAAMAGGGLPGSG